MLLSLVLTRDSNKDGYLNTFSDVPVNISLLAGLISVVKTWSTQLCKFVAKKIRAAFLLHF